MGISGVELGQKMLEQVKALGAEVLLDGVGRIELIKEESGGSEGSGDRGNYFKILTEAGKEFLAKTLIVATGTERRKLNVPGEKEYFGKGVSYCSTCDAPFFKDKTVVVIGGSNAACSGASHVAEFAKKVYLIYRKDELRAEPAWVQDVKNNPAIEIIYNTNVMKVLGKKEIGEVGGVELDTSYKGEKILKTDGVFIEIGGVPLSSLLIPLKVEIDENNYIKVNESMETNIPGIFAAGDFTIHSLVLSQTITACADGAIAAASAYKYLKGQKAPKIAGS
jgi:thioredoxin reductase (NADPH)